MKHRHARFLGPDTQANDDISICRTVDIKTKEVFIRNDERGLLRNQGTVVTVQEPIPQPELQTGADEPLSSYAFILTNENMLVKVFRLIRRVFTL